MRSNHSGYIQVFTMCTLLTWLSPLRCLKVPRVPNTHPQSQGASLAGGLHRANGGKQKVSFCEVKYSSYSGTQCEAGCWVRRGLSVVPSLTTATFWGWRWGRWKVSLLPPWIDTLSTLWIVFIKSLYLSLPLKFHNEQCKWFLEVLDCL